MKKTKISHGVILSYISIFVSNIVQLIYLPILISKVGQSNYGLLQLSTSVAGYLTILNFGLASTYIRYYTKYKLNSDENEVSKLNALFLVTLLILGVLSFIIGLALVYFSRGIFSHSMSFSELDILQILLLISVIDLSTAIPFSLFQSYIFANENYLFDKLTSIAKSVITPALIVGLLFLNFNVIAVVAIRLALNILFAVFNYIYCKKILNFRMLFKKLDFSLLKEIVIFSSFIFIGMLVDQINWQVDKTILGVIRGSVAVAVYGLAAQFNLYYLVFNDAISSVFAPKVNQLHFSTELTEEERSREINTVFQKVGRVQIIVLGFILSSFLLFGKAFILFLFGNDYLVSYYVALILMIPVTIPLIQSVGIEIQRAKNLHKFRSMLYLFIAILNIFLSIPLAKIYGPVGSAIGTAFSIILGNGIIMNYYYHRRVGINVIAFWIKISMIIPVYLVGIVVMSIIISVIGVNSIMHFLVLSIIYIILIAILLWVFVISKGEKEMLIRRFK